MIAGDTKHLQTLMKSETPKVIPLMIKGYGRASMLPMVFSRKDKWCFCGQHATHAKSYFIMQKGMGLKSVSRKISLLINWSWQFHTMTMTFGVSPNKKHSKARKKIFCCLHPGKMQVGTVDQPVSSNVADGKIPHKWRFIAGKDMELNGDVCS